LSAALVAPGAEAILPRAEHRHHTQRLYNALLELPIEKADREGMMAAFEHHTRFPGFGMFLPIFRDAEESCGWDYLHPDEDLLVFPRGIEPCENHHQEHLEAFQQTHLNDTAAKRPSLAPDRHFLDIETTRTRLSLVRRLECGNPFSTPGAETLRLRFRPSLEGAPQTHKGASTDHFDRWVDLLRGVLTRGGQVAILAHTDPQIERIANLLAHRDLESRQLSPLLPRLSEGLASGDDSSRILIGRGDLAGQLWLEDEQLLVLPETTLFGEVARKAPPPSTKLQNYLTSFRDLKVGDLVVHVLHGIGRYKGLTRLEAGGHSGDFLLIEYGAGDKLYLPVDRLSLLQRYSGGTDSAPPSALDRLGTGAWEKRKDRVRKAVRDMADELLKAQAERSLAQGPRLMPPGDLYFSFEAAFPYEETDDQRRAIDEVNTDLVSARPMDRLVCGDVGFGKTEVALRAIFRVVAEGLQALVLVPTTVLCYQHFRNFQERLSPFGIRVGQVSRFVKGVDLKDALRGFQEGKTDVLVGTHRLLSGDIIPRRLGLLVIDEEQRFGVAHKEHLKRIRAGVPVMTLTATPIPRTLHMSMLGLKDISIITTPPQDRLSVKTYFTRFDETLVKEAIQHELRRGGQVFFVHNRVDDIEDIRNYLGSLLPGIDIRVAHGQMREGQLEKVIIDFLEQRFQVLVCTTIIESGIDMPNVNTLIVNNADYFGLAQLYQIRGRVGRSSAQAFAYFFVGANKRLSDEAHKRLDILSSHQELGAGFHIASCDLEMRGAGNLLGGEQSGHVASIGLEMYTSLLDAAIREARGKPVPKETDTEIKIPVSALIPTDYIPSESLRLQFYKAMFSARGTSEIDRLHEEARDRFGAPPPEFVRLIRVAALKLQLRRSHAIMLTSTGRGDYEVRFGPLGEPQIAALMELVRRQPDRYQLLPNYRLLLRTGNIKIPTPPDDPQEEILQRLLVLADPLASQLERTEHVE
jgi:transcription-repair coupling factor (superfamily II helicase)